MNDFFVSVIVPVYNGEKFLAQAIESIRAQNYAPLEILIVDDGSTDSTAALCAQWSDVRYVRQENQGPSAARNRAMEIARGEVITFLDADDLWQPDTLHTFLSHFENNPSVDLVLGWVQMVRLASAETLRFEKFHEPRLSLNLGAMAVRKTALDRIGLFNEKLWDGEDVDWFLRARESGISIALLNRVTLLYRVHGENMTLKRESQWDGFLQAVALSLKRRRGTDNNATLLPPVEIREHPNDST